MDSLNFPSEDRIFLEPHLPPKDGKTSSPSLPFTTLTFATSLDSQLSLSPGTRTVLSGPQSKAMTHYLRSRHDAILIGVGTAVADNPGLNCRLAGVGGYGSEGLAGQPRPIIIDPSARWEFTAQSKIFELARNGRGRAPFIITAAETVPPAAQREVLESHGGKFIALPVGIDDSNGAHRIDWTALLECLVCEGLNSVMIEGGGSIINSLLEPGCQSLVDSVIVTIAPTWLGQGGVVVSPRRRVEGGVAVPASRLTGVKWYPFGEDVVLCGRIKGDV
ncbi:2,5-diamino-6-(ribosylamino)-4(3H)-pyrimidinone 5'-phosphate reductase [Aspergillus brasiliensis]|uniref:2,5-diamino-6-ribosylamino-4(3H)-pyrimidinone 5'-phosphate reductase n=1 Tax=Aspergillus brasiliensis TaxID=319629 RepID=A0A9W5YWZ5_9EURO|nr:2,5-diamino-6-(ribosylamino)-4(3H)-pyrimidinone 5'-phosphate reductase [Aspergillus brasiliensis]GKZ47194.1 2,5-diamino-6-(ribosylamino)-4(3H)-pyrimidinone 5'-phosphate reductase [Aspergillus brasiliensis]